LQTIDGFHDYDPNYPAQALTDSDAQGAMANFVTTDERDTIDSIV
jgi:hypothetical protein